MAASAIALVGLSLLAAPAWADDWENEASASARENASRGQEHEHNHDHDTSAAVDNRPPREKYAFELPYANKDGNLSFDQLCDSNKPFILVWWLSDCPVCHLEMPYVQKLQNQIDEGKVDLRIVSINIDFGTDDCLDFCKERGVSFEVLHDSRARRTDPGFRIDDLGTPATYIFKPGGELADTIFGWTGNYPDKVIAALDLETKPDANAEAAAPAGSQPAT